MKITSENIIKIIIASAALALIAASCSTQKKLSTLQKGEGPAVQLNLAKEENQLLRQPEIL